VAAPSNGTGFELTVNVVLVEFAGTVTLAGTVALAVVRLSNWTVKLAGAGPVIVRVAVDGLPPRTLVGLIASPLSVGG